MGDSTKEAQKRVYEKARDNLSWMDEEKTFTHNKKEYFYIYRQIMKGRAQTGVVVCTPINDYSKGIIKKHENTCKDKERDRINHVGITDANTGSVFLTYKAKEEVNEIVNN